MTVVEHLSGQRPVEECGVLDISAPAASQAAAQQCVAAAFAADTPFYVLWDSQGFEGIVNFGLVADLNGEELRVRFVSHDSYGADVLTTWTTCSTFDIPVRCLDAETLCYECEAREQLRCGCVEGDSLIECSTLCRGAALDGWDRAA